MPNETLKAAWFYRERNLCTIPIRPGTKQPAIPWTEYQKRLPTEEELVDWFAERPNGMAIVCGPVSGVIAIDIDGKSGRELFTRLPKSDMMTRSSSGKGHVYLRIREGQVVSTRIRIHGILADLKGDRSYCLAAPSIHPVTGKPYERIGSWDLDKVPFFDEKLFGAVAAKGGPREPVVDADEDLFQRMVRARAYLARIEPAISGKGGHNKTMYAAGCLIQKFRLTIEQAWPLILEYNERCVPPWRIQDIRRKLQEAYRNALE